MAIVQFEIDEIVTRGDHSHVIIWRNLANGDTGAPLEMPGSTERSVQVFGTFGVLGNLRIEGSNDKVRFDVLTEPQGHRLDIDEQKIERVTGLTRLIRPRVTAGDGTTSLTVFMLLRRTNNK